jgi:hypothetical protein
VLPEHPEIALAGDRGAGWDGFECILWNGFGARLIEDRVDFGNFKPDGGDLEAKINRNEVLQLDCRIDSLQPAFSASRLSAMT